MAGEGRGEGVGELNLIAKSSFTHFSLYPSLTEKIGVRAGTLEANRVTVHAVNQYPIGFDMQVAPWLPFTFQRVVAKLAWESLAGQKQADNAA